MRVVVWIAAMMLAVGQAQASEGLKKADLAAAVRAVSEGYPHDALAREASTAALLDVWIDEKGKIFRCQLIGKIGDERLASAACDLIVKHGRGRIRPARDNGGSPVAARVVELLKLTVAGSRDERLVSQAQKQPDIELPVTQLPEGAKSVDVDLVLAVGADGIVSDCGRDGSTGKEAFVSAGCKNLIGSDFGRGLSAAGEPLAYVQRVKVRFAVP